MLLSLGVDGTNGVTDEDEEVASHRYTPLLRVLVVNKKDNPATEQDGLLGLLRTWLRRALCHCLLYMVTVLVTY